MASCLPVAPPIPSYHYPIPSIPDMFQDANSRKRSTPLCTWADYCGGVPQNRSGARAAKQENFYRSGVKIYLAIWTTKSNLI